MNLSRFVFFIFLLSSFCSCKNDSTADSKDATANSASAGQVSTVDSTQPPLFNEIMTIHDEIMPQMNDIEVLKQNVRMKMDSIDALNGSEEYRNQFRHAMSELNRADNMMSDWMFNFKENYDTIKSEKVRQTFLESERAKIEGVKMTMSESIKVAQMTLKNTPIK